MFTLCLDIGGTKIAAGLADAEGTLVHTATCPTPAGVSAEQVWGAVAAMIAEDASFIVIGGFAVIANRFVRAEIHGELPLEPIPGLDT